MPTWFDFRVEERVSATDDEWARLCEAVVYRNNLDLSSGERPTILEGYGVVWVVSAEDLSDEQRADLSAKLTREADELIKAARVARALRAAESVEQVRDSLTATSRALEAIKDGAATMKTGAEYAEVVQRWAPTIVTAWAWLAPHLKT